MSEVKLGQAGEGEIVTTIPKLLCYNIHVGYESMLEGFEKKNGKDVWSICKGMLMERDDTEIIELLVRRIGRE